MTPSISQSVAGLKNLFSSTQNVRVYVKNARRTACDDLDFTASHFSTYNPRYRWISLARFSRPRLSGSLWYQKQIHHISDSRAKFKLTERFNPKKGVPSKIVQTETNLGKNNEEYIVK